VVRKEVLLVDVERANVAWNDDRPGPEYVGFHLVAHHQVTVVLERDEPAIEEVVDVWRQQEAVAAVELLLVGGVLPRLDVAGAQVVQLSDPRDPARLLIEADVVLEESLPNTCVDELSLLGFSQIHATLEGCELSFDDRHRGVLLENLFGRERELVTHQGS
jgi:hypothetical protein